MNLKRKSAPAGNKYGTKLKDPNYRQLAYEQWCKHISEGYSKKSWHFKHPTDKSKCICWETMERYIEENPTEFDPFLLKQAYSEAYKMFEIEGFKLMRGQYRNGSPETWKTFMRNKFNWDKEILDQAVKCSADKILEEIRSRNTDKQDHYKKIKDK